MTLKNNKDDRRTHRLVTYLSATENDQFNQAFNQSCYNKPSEFHRTLILESINNIPSNVELTPVNPELALTLSKSVQAMCRYIAQLELLSCCFEDSNKPELKNKVEDIIEQVKQIGDICYRLARFYRADSSDKQQIAQMVELIFTSIELSELCQKVRDAEEAL